MSDASVAELQVELTAAQNKRTELKQEFFQIHAALREKKAALDRLKITHDSSSTSNKYSRSLELEGAIAELQQREEIINDTLQEMDNTIMLLKYRIDNKK